MTHSQILNLTSNMTDEELCNLNRDLVGIIKHRRKMAAKDMGASLLVGDKVRVTDVCDVSEGVVKKVMRTRAVVLIKGKRYKVPMNLITLIRRFE